MSELREDIEAIQVMGLGRYLYARFVYRHHMRFIHKRGGHQMRHIGPIYPDGGEFDKCDWCGHLENFVPARTPLWDKLVSEGEQAQAQRITSL
jgi:hypothetical protein